MWKNSHAGSLSISTPVEPPVPPTPRPIARPAVAAVAQSCIGKDLVIVGNITGADSVEPLFIDGRVEGSIALPCSRVTVGFAGQVKAGIVARDAVVMGKVLGNITASNRLDIRALGTVIGDVSAPRISIEDGAFVRGRLEVIAAKAESVVAAELVAAASAVVHAPQETPRMILVQPEVRKPHVHRSLQTA